MTLGLKWDESLPYTDERNSEIAMERAKDRYRFILEQPIVTEPGSTWQYSGGSTALLAHLIARGTGKQLHDYAKEKLFDPLGIDNSYWTLGTNGEPAAASGLRLTARDLARVGRMILNKGKVWWKADRSRGLACRVICPACAVRERIVVRLSVVAGDRFSIRQAMDGGLRQWRSASGHDPAP